MSDDRRDLTLGLNVEGAPEAKRAIDELGKSVESVTPVTDAVTSAIKALEGAIKSVRAAGLPVPPEALTLLDDLKAKLALGSSELEKMGQKAGAASKQTAEFRAQVPLATNVLGPFGSVLSSLSKSADQSTASLAQTAIKVASLAGGIGIALIAIQHLPEAFHAVESAGTALGEMYSRLVGDTEAAVAALSKEEIALRKVESASKANADAHEINLRAQIAAITGLIQATDNVRFLNIEYQAQQNLLHGITSATGDFAAGLKEMGIEVGASSDEVLARVTTFMLRYKTLLEKEGPVAAENFAKLNKKFFQDIVNDAEQSGARVPLAFQKIVDGYGIASKAVEDSNKAIDKQKAKLLELEKSLDDHAKKLQEHAREIERHRQVQEQSADAELASARKNISGQMAELERQHREGLVGEEHYRSEFARLQNEQVDARRERDRRIDELNAEADGKQVAARAANDTEVEHTKEKIGEVAAAKTAVELQAEKEHGRALARVKELEAANERLITQAENINVKNALWQKAAEENAKLTLTWFEKLANKIDDMSGGLENVVNNLKQIDVGGAPTGGGTAGGF